MRERDADGSRDLKLREPETLDPGIQTFTETELAQGLRCSRAALRKMRREHRGPRWTRVGRLVRYPAEWVHDYLKQNGEGGGTKSRETGKGVALPISDSTQADGGTSGCLIASVPSETADARCSTQPARSGQRVR